MQISQSMVEKILYSCCKIKDFSEIPLTLTFLINGHARLFISEKFETLPALIAPCPIINFPNFVQPTRLPDY